jgi:hypothetical protein
MDAGLPGPFSGDADELAGSDLGGEMAEALGRGDSD